MGLFAKVRDILFEEEEITEPVKVVKEEKKVEEPIAKVVKEPEIKERVVKEEVRRPKDDFDSMGERELFKSEKTFPFPDFDEEEFSSSVSRQKTKTTNVMEYERKRKVEKRTDFGRYERTEVRETVERKKFKPSPIISPVYGILNEDYTINDIKSRKVENDNLDIETVRKKAFEPEILDVPKTTYYEETVTVRVKEPEEEKIQKVKTIDDLLEDTSDEIIDVIPSHSIKDDILYDEIEDELENVDASEVENDIEEPEDDTLENDLFDLIDSMYESREDGDY